MDARWHGVLVLGLASAAVDVDLGARRLLEEGADPASLAEVDQFVRTLELDPTTRDRALLLAERTRWLADGAATDTRRSLRVRAEAGASREADTAPLVGLASLWRHELATPLAVVDLALDTLEAHRDDPTTVERALEVARRNLHLAKHFLDGLSTLGGLDTGQVELSWAQVDLGTLVRESIDDITPLLSRHHEVAVSVDRYVAVPADRDAVRQILVNLVTNADKFSPDDAHIEVTVSATRTTAEVAVRDHGPGLDPQDADRIFEAGRRLDPGTPGMGLGLFIARQLARAHGGTLLVEHPTTGGSRFVLHLPRTPAAWQESLQRREEAGTARDLRQRQRSAIADARDATLDDREAGADRRDALLDDREDLADERDADLDRREEG